jgi:hypothetical protein
MAEWAIEQRKICESVREIKACKNKVLSFIDKFKEDKTTEYVTFLDTHPDTDMLTKSYLRLLITMQVNAALLGLTSNKSVEQIMNYEYNQCLNGPSK